MRILQCAFRDSRSPVVEENDDSVRLGPPASSRSGDVVVFQYDAIGQPPPKPHRHHDVPAGPVVFLRRQETTAARIAQVKRHRVRWQYAKCINEITYVEPNLDRIPGLLDVHFILSLLVIRVVGGHVKGAGREGQSDGAILLVRKNRCSLQRPADELPIDLRLLVALLRTRNDPVVVRKPAFNQATRKGDVTDRRPETGLSNDNVHRVIVFWINRNSSCTPLRGRMHCSTSSLDDDC